MIYQTYSNLILEELRKSILSLKEHDLEKFIAKIQTAPKIYCDGKGRSGLIIKGFAMRLAQMGISSYDVGGVTTPAIEKGDLLIVASGSGQTPSLIEHAQKAKLLNAEIALITASPNASIVKESDYSFCFQAESKQTEEKLSIQPMGTLFEQSLELFLDIVVLMLMERMKINNNDMYNLHNNLE